MTFFFNGRIKNFLFYPIAVAAFALALELFHPVLSFAQSQSGVRVSSRIHYGGYTYSSTGGLSRSQNGSINYTAGTTSGVLAPGETRDVSNAASVTNVGNGANVGVKVDTKNGFVRLGSINISPNTKSVDFEGQVDVTLPFDFFFLAAALTQNSEWSEPDGSISNALDIWTPWFSLSLLRDGRGNHGGILDVNGELIGLELSNKEDCSTLRELILGLSLQGLGHSANLLSTWYRKICSK
jgi:hypothetical protein